MTKTGMGMLLAVVVTVLLGAADKAQDAERLLKAAANMELVDGNLKGAIEQYKKVAESGNRAVAVQALIRMAECYQKLGDVEARGIYERVVREYSDQREAVALARARLKSGSDPSSGGMILRRIWAGQGVDNEGAVSTDGRYVSFPDWITGDLAVRDLVTGTNRHLTEHQNPGSNYVEYAEESSLSRDSSQVAYSWFNGTDRYELRALPLQPSSSMAQPRRVYDNPDVLWIAPYDWSPDGKWISVQIQRRDRTAQIGLVSTQDGALRVLKSVNWRGTSRIFMSPDGQYIAYDLPASDTAMTDRDVFLMATDGSHESRVVSAPGENRVMGFAPDGTRLLFGSDRRGPFGLWSISVTNGRADDQPVLIKPDVAPASLGITKVGTLFTIAAVGFPDVQVASVDLQSGKVVSAPAPVVNRFIGANIQPDWSPDGQRLAFVSNRNIGHNNRAIVVRDDSTGAMRELHPELNYFGPPRWTRDGRGILVRGTDLKGQNGVYRIDSESGEMRLLVSNVGGGNGMAEMSPDGKKLYFWTGGALAASPGPFFVEHDLASGANRQLFNGDGPYWPFLSPDGRYLAGIISDERSRVSSLQVIQIDNGNRSELFRTSAPAVLRSNVAWTPDSAAIIVRREQKEAADCLVIPLDGTMPRKLDLTIPELIAGLVRLHPDGRRLAFAAGKARAELWTLDNFLPSPTARR